MVYHKCILKANAFSRRASTKGQKILIFTFLHILPFLVPLLHILPHAHLPNICNILLWILTLMWDMWNTPAWCFYTVLQQHNFRKFTTHHHLFSNTLRSCILYNVHTSYQILHTSTYYHNFLKIPHNRTQTNTFFFTQQIQNFYKTTNNKQQTTKNNNKKKRSVPPPHDAQI